MGDLMPCEHQVAGWHNGSLSCVLKNKKGQILKPIKLNANPTFSNVSVCPSSAENGSKEINDAELIPVCRDELAFYELVAASTKLDDVALKTLIPEFHGCQEVTKKDGQVTPHLILQDLAHEFLHPCVMDIKLGRSQEYPSKPKNNKRKYATQNSHGFCLTGVRVFHPNSGHVILDLRPNACKQLTSNEVFNGLEVFCQGNSSESTQIRKAIIEGLTGIRKWMQEQRSYKIRRGSVLIMYDASQIGGLSSKALMSLPKDTGADVEHLKKLNVIVKMIDFAHVFHACGEQDDNYLAGLDNLIDFYSKSKS